MYSTSGTLSSNPLVPSTLPGCRNIRDSCSLVARWSARELSPSLARFPRFRPLSLLSPFFLPPAPVVIHSLRPSINQPTSQFEKGTPLLLLQRSPRSLPPPPTTPPSTLTTSTHSRALALHSHRQTHLTRRRISFAGLRSLAWPPPILPNHIPTASPSPLPSSATTRVVPDESLRGPSPFQLPRPG